MKHLVPASSETAKAESVLLTGGPVSQSGMVPWSWRLRPSLQPLPPVLHPPPPPPSQGLGRWLRGQMALEVQAASWARHPCSPPPTTLLHSCSYSHPLTPPTRSSPSPVETPEPQRSSVPHDWANTALHQNAAHVSPLQLPWLARNAKTPDATRQRQEQRRRRRGNKGAATKGQERK